MLRRAFNFTRRWLAQVVLIVSLLLLAVMLLFDERVLPYEYEWGRHPSGTISTISYYGLPGRPAGIRGSYGVFNWGRGRIRVWHYGIVESQVDPAIHQINADLPAGQPFRFKPSDLAIQTDGTAQHSGLFSETETGELKFCWSHNYNFMGDLLPFGPAFGTYWTVDVSDTIPEIVLVLLAAWSGTVLFRRLIKRFRFRPGFCRNCSYDLTGNTSGVCPECGHKIAAAS